MPFGKTLFGGAQFGGHSKKLISLGVRKKMSQVTKIPPPPPPRDFISERSLTISPLVQYKRESVKCARDEGSRILTAYNIENCLMRHTHVIVMISSKFLIVFKDFVP